MAGPKNRNKWGCDMAERLAIDFVGSMALLVLFSMIGTELEEVSCE